MTFSVLKLTPQMQRYLVNMILYHFMMEHFCQKDLDFMYTFFLTPSKTMTLQLVTQTFAELYENLVI